MTLGLVRQRGRNPVRLICSSLSITLSFSATRRESTATGTTNCSTSHSTAIPALLLGIGLRRKDSPPVDAVDFFSKGAPLEMVSSESVRASNSQGHRITDFVGIFVGGTGGIGESTAIELFKRTVRPRIYIVGR